MAGARVVRASRAAWLTAAIVLLPRAGAARSPCSPRPVEPHVEARSPLIGATEVPVDTLVWGAPRPSEGLDELVLLGQDGEEIELLADAELQAAIPLVGVLRPARPLSPETAYQVWRCREDLCDELVTEFRTGATTAGPPERPSLLEQRTRQESGEPWVDLTLEFDGVVAIGDASDEFAGSDREGEVIALHGDPAAPVRLFVGSECEGVRSGTWPYAGSAAELRFGAYNLAGAFSGWSEPERVEVGSTACRVGSGGLPGLVVVVLVARRRRRR